jgi:hypothetical protein
MSNNIEAWVFDPKELPDFDRAVFALLDTETNYIHPGLTILKLVDNGAASNPPVLWHCVEIDLEAETSTEELLQQVYTVIAWRYKND